MAFPFARLVGLGLGVALLATACSVPDLDVERVEAPPLPQTSFLYDANGRLITALHAEQDRVLIPPRRIPRVVKDAVVAIEDRRFWSHGGVDLKALLRAASVNAAEGKIVQGGSTITQQYVKNTIVGAERSLERKVKEALLAYRLERELSKEEILGRYLNTVYFGRGAYGIQQAAKSFFSRPARDVTLAQAALLAGMIANPAEYDPVDHPEAARERRNEVLGRMVDLGMLSERKADRATAAELRLKLAPERDRYPAAHFVQYVKSRILRDPRFGQTYTQRYNLLFGGGLRIHTTIDLAMQRAAEEAVRGVLSQPRDPYGALVAIDPRTGHVKAMVGGRDFFATQKEDPFAQVNLATGGSTGRQGGSAFKPFALVAALENGISPAQTYRGGSSIVMDDPVCRSAPGVPWVVENYEGTSFGDLTVERATISSVNVVYAQLIRDVGPQRVVEAAQRMGIRSELRGYCSSVLGTNEVNPLEMASAFGTLATNGLRVAPTGIERITDASGKVLFEATPKGKQVVDPGVAWTATQILRKVVLYGTGKAAGIGRPAAGKTGTAQLWRDAWFTGFIPQLSAAVWVGFPQGQVSMVPPRTRTRVTGGSFPAQIWNAFMTGVTAGMPVEDFEQPDSELVSVAIDVTRGCVATSSTPDHLVRVVRFVAGTEPTNRCPEPTAPASQEVPSVIGMSVGAASDLLEGAGFSVERVAEYDPSYPSGTVLRQAPGAGREVAFGSSVTLTVSTKDPPLSTVPNVIGRGEAQARSRLEGAGFQVVVTEASSHQEGVKAGRVVEQTPEGGAERPVGSTVTIVLNPPA